HRRGARVRGAPSSGRALYRARRGHSAHARDRVLCRAVAFISPYFLRLRRVPAFRADRQAAPITPPGENLASLDQERRFAGYMLARSVLASTTIPVPMAINRMSAAARTYRCPGGGTPIRTTISGGRS